MNCIENMEWSNTISKKYIPNDKEALSYYMNKGQIIDDTVLYLGKTQQKSENNPTLAY